VLFYVNSLNSDVALIVTLRMVATNHCLNEQSLIVRITGRVSNGPAFLFVSPKDINLSQMIHITDFC
jgi:hypothetical protein